MKIFIISLVIAVSHIAIFLKFHAEIFGFLLECRYGRIWTKILMNSIFPKKLYIPKKNTWPNKKIHWILSNMYPFKNSSILRIIFIKLISTIRLKSIYFLNRRWCYFFRFEIFLQSVLIHDISKVRNSKLYSLSINQKKTLCNTMRFPSTSGVFQNH